MYEHAARLIPELTDMIAAGCDIDLPEYLGCVGRYDHAVAYGSVFWPDFIEHDGCIFLHPLDDRGKKIYTDWLRTLAGDRERVERVMNHRHITDIFTNSAFPATREIIRHIGNLLEDMWSCKLQRDFPQRRFVVEFFGPDDDEGELVDFQIYFCQTKD